MNRSVCFDCFAQTGPGGLNRRRKLSGIQPTTQHTLSMRHRNNRGQSTLIPWFTLSEWCSFAPIFLFRTVSSLYLACDCCLSLHDPSTSSPFKLCSFLILIFPSIFPSTSSHSHIPFLFLFLPSPFLWSRSILRQHTCNERVQCHRSRTGFQVSRWVIQHLMKATISRWKISYENVTWNTLKCHGKNFLRTRLNCLESGSVRAPDGQQVGQTRVLRIHTDNGLHNLTWTSCECTINYPQYLSNTGVLIMISLTIITKW